MSKQVIIHVRRDRIARNVKKDNGTIEDDGKREAVCKASTYDRKEYGDRVEVRCSGCGQTVIELVSKWDETDADQRSCGASVYLRSDTDLVDVIIHDNNGDSVRLNGA